MVGRARTEATILNTIVSMFSVVILLVARVSFKYLVLKRKTGMEVDVGSCNKILDAVCLMAV